MRNFFSLAMILAICTTMTLRIPAQEPSDPKVAQKLKFVDEYMPGYKATYLEAAKFDKDTADLMLSRIAHLALKNVELGHTLEKDHKTFDSASMEVKTMLEEQTRTLAALRENAKELKAIDSLIERRKSFLHGLTILSIGLTLIIAGVGCYFFLCAFLPYIPFTKGLRKFLARLKGLKTKDKEAWLALQEHLGLALGNLRNASKLLEDGEKVAGGGRKLKWLTSATTSLAKSLAGLGVEAIDPTDSQLTEVGSKVKEAVSRLGKRQEELVRNEAALQELIEDGVKGLRLQIALDHRQLQLDQNKLADDLQSLKREQDNCARDTAIARLLLEEAEQKLAEAKRLQDHAEALEAAYAEVDRQSKL
jgi:hypothetical protein